MACNREGPKCAEVASVLERYQAERDNDQENSFLMNVPAKQE